METVLKDYWKDYRFLTGIFFELIKRKGTEAVVGYGGHNILLLFFT